MRGLRYLSLAAGVALALTACARLGFRQADDSRLASDASRDRGQAEGAPSRDGPADAGPGDGARLDGKSTVDQGPAQFDLKKLPDLKHADTKAAPDLKHADTKPPPDSQKPLDTGTIPSAVFTAVSASSPPSARRSTGAALESLGLSVDRIWIFGGFTSAGLKNDLYHYTTSAASWTTVVQAGTPGARERHALAWHPSAGTLLLFGGQGGFLFFTPLDELFSFAPGSGTWTSIAKGVVWPAARRDPAMVWVPHLGKHLLYGGNKGSAASDRFSDLWLLALSGTTATWTPLSSSGTAPAQSGGCVAYDPSGRRLILFGGETQDGVSVGTTYQYLLDSNLWQQDSPGGTVPGARAFGQCAWNPALGRVVLYGGQNSAGTPLDGAFLYDPTAKKWTIMVTSLPSPGPRADGSAVYSPSLGGLFWFGGRTGLTSYTNESWLLKVL